MWPVSNCSNVATSTGHVGYYPADGALSASFNDCISTPFLSSVTPTTSAPEAPIYLLVSVTIFYLVIFVAGVVGNSLVMLVVWRNAEMHNTTNCFIVNLSVADLLVIVVCMPTALTVLHSKDVWLLGHFMCKIVPILESTVTLTSVLTILAIAFERYHAICRPFRARFKCTLWRMTCMVACLWCVALLACIPFVLMTDYSLRARVDGSSAMMCEVNIGWRWQRGYMLSLTVITYILPLGTLSVVYGIIARQLVRDTAAAQLRQDRHSLAYVKARKQVVIMLATVVVLFFVCLLPMHVVRLCSIYCSQERMRNLGLEGYLNLVNFARVMLYLNSVVNPVCYSMISSKFRDAFRRAIQRQNSPRYSYRSSSSNAGYVMRSRCAPKRTVNPPTVPITPQRAPPMSRSRRLKSTETTVVNNDESLALQDEVEKMFSEHAHTSQV